MQTGRDKKTVRAGIGAGIVTAAGLVALCALGALTATAILALSKAVDTWLAALIVTAANAGVAAALIVYGKALVRREAPLDPEHALEKAKKDLEWAKQRLDSARR